MPCCSSLRKRWQRFLGRLSPTHALLFQLLLLLLLAANVFGLVLNGRRLQNSYAHPASILSVHRVDELPPFSVILQLPFAGNTSISCSTGSAPTAVTCQQTLWPASDSAPALLFGPAAVPGARAVVDPLTRAPFQLQVSVQNYPAHSGCLVGFVLGEALSTLPVSSFSDAFSSSLSPARFSFCPGSDVPGAVDLWSAALAFSAVQRTSGRVEYTVSVTEDSMNDFMGTRMMQQVQQQQVMQKQQQRSGVLVPSQASMQQNPIAAVANPLLPAQHLMVLHVESVSSQLLIAWETEEVMYPWTDFLVSSFAYANISLTILAFMFPWRYVREMQTSRGREFKLACRSSGGADDTEDEEEVDSAQVDAESNSTRRLHERMLPHADASVQV